jgi:5-methylcytosine-specific restriction endonuclease McrA
MLMENIMKCAWEGCEKNRAKQGSKNGKVYYFLWCSAHRADRYQRHKKDYCENIDKRLGFMCDALPMFPEMLEVDHIDGNRKNNKLENLQTLCANCHQYKTLTQDTKHHKKEKIC